MNDGQGYLASEKRSSGKSRGWGLVERLGYAPINLTTTHQTPDFEVQNINRPKTPEMPAHVARKIAKPIERKSKAKARVTLKSPCPKR